MTYQVTEKKLDRLIAACDKLGETGLTIRGTAEEREFILSLGELRDELLHKNIDDLTDAKQK